MARLIAVTQEIEVDPRTGRLRDTLDHSWTRFLAAAGLAAAPLPSDPDTAEELFRWAPFDGLVLAGGAAPDSARDQVDDLERRLMRLAVAWGLPLLGVGRGMELVLERAAPDGVEVLARAHDGAVEAALARDASHLGLMRRPDLSEPFAPDDVARVRALFAPAPAPAS